MRCLWNQLYCRSVALCAACLALLSSTLPANTLQEQLEQAVSAFSSGDYAASYWQFESLELDYGEEPEFQNTRFQQTILPVRAYAALMADRPTDALIYFSELLRNHAPQAGLRAFILYNAAIAQAQTGAEARAAQTFEAFRLSFPASNEAGLALLQQADLLSKIGETGAAEQLLDDFYRSDAPQSLRMQGRLRALQLAGTTRNTERVQEILFQTDWQISAMPDIAVLSFSALDAGDLLLGQGLPDQALRAYRLTLPRDYLVKKQEERLASAESTLAQQALFASSIWKSHWQQVISRLKRQLEHLRTMPDYTPGLYLRKGQAYLLAKRHREASLLFRIVAHDASYEAGIRAEAHYRWILSVSEAGQWEQARAIAQEFLKIHPGHALANSALFLIARAYQAEGSYPEAIEVLDNLIANFPDDEQAPRWYFTRGHNYCVLEDQDAARTNFNTALERFPQSALALQTELWHCLTYFFERNYDTSLQGILKLIDKAKTQPLYPEIQYRLANIQYAKRSYEDALSTADWLIESYPAHHRIPEAQALRGDIYMGLGELSRAAHAFRQVSEDDAQLYDYATFQAAKIYKALERYDQQREHLQAYVDREDADERARVSEALYWIGWTLQQQGRAEDAFPVFEDALERFGNKPAARAVDSILSAYADLYRRNANDQRIDFDTWLQQRSEQSLQTGQLTWFSRLTLFTANRQRHKIDDETAEATTLSIHRLVPIEQQSPEAVEAIGLALLKRGYQSADDSFEYILNEYPKHPARASAYYGKAKLAANTDRLDQAQRWLIRFLEETPTHPLAAETRLLAAEVLTKQGRHANATAALNEILQIKELRGRPHARALAGLARIETELEQPKRAIAYWQRVYTLYRAYPELISTAYWESALLFEQLGDAIAARNTVHEMLRDERLNTFEPYSLAQAKLPELEAAAAKQSQVATTESRTEEAVQ